MNDYSEIRLGRRNKRISWQDTSALHRESVDWLVGELAKPCNSKSVVVTHHAPSFKSWKGYVNKASHSQVVLNDEDIYKNFYCSDLEYLMEKPIELWIHGHLHHSLDYKINGVRIVCNPYGYSEVKFNDMFNANMIVTV